MFLCRICAAIAVAICLVKSASADIIVQTGSTGIQSVILDFGQSFTATTSELLVETVSFGWSNLNAGLADPVLTAAIYQGVGFGGSLLGSVTLPAAIPDGTPEVAWIDFTFSSPIALVSGQVYSIRWTHTPAGNVSGAHINATEVYSGGAGLDGSGNPHPGGADTYFRVLAVAVPEAGGFAFGGAALTTLGIAACIRRKLTR